MKNKPLVLLIVDDDPDDRDLFVEAVQEINKLHKCIVAADGEEALTLLRVKNAVIPDYIFLDLNMPRMNGRSFFSEIKKDTNLDHIPVIIYSTSKRPEDILEMKRRGALDFITKPKTFDEICNAISGVLTRKQIMVH